jgi:hypothetical protein
MLSRSVKSLLAVPLLAWLAACPLAAQDWIVPDLQHLQRLDLRDLGYTLVNEIPSNSSAITSLLTAADGKIYGGTSGDEAYLFVFDPKINKVRHLGRIKGQQAIHHSLVQDREGYLYFGTGLNPFAPVQLSKGELGDFVDRTLWKDIQNHFKDYPGGHLFRYSPKESDKEVKLPDMECDVLDLGIPAANNSVYAMTISPEGKTIYGVTYPDGFFFTYDIAAKVFKTVGRIDSLKAYHGPERDWRSLPRALVCDDSGRVFTSGLGGNLFYFDPSAGKLVRTEMRVPGDRYPGQSIDYAVVENFARACDGTIYGGSSDGYLFAFCPDKMELRNLGKLRSNRRLRALTVGLDGRVYMMAGERTSTRPNQMFRYDPARACFDNLGVLIVDRSPYYYWRGYQFDCMVTGADGTLFLGESERQSHLFFYIPE